MLSAGFRAALDQQWAGVAARGLPCGAAVTGPGGAVLARGRNRAYDPPTGTDPLEGSPLAHAELNALARVPTGTDPAALTLWSTQRPCAMCSAAIAFLAVPDVRYLAEDPSPAAQSDREFRPLGDPYWAAVSTVLFLYSGAVLRGPGDRNLARQAAGRPVLTSLVRELAAEDRLGTAARAGVELAAALGGLDRRLAAVAAEIVRRPVGASPGRYCGSPGREAGIGRVEELE